MPFYRLPLILSACVVAVVALVVLLNQVGGAAPGPSLATALALGVGTVPTARLIDRLTRPAQLRRYGRRRAGP